MRVSFSVELDVRRPPAPKRRSLAAAALVGLLLVPAATLASHQFTDVPTSHTFHSDIDRAKGAGLTAGCSATTFCPDQALTRGQMTAFLNRGLGRLESSLVSGNVSNGSLTTVATAVVRAGNPAGGTQLVMVTAHISAKASASCPCELFGAIYEGTDELSATWFDVPAVPAGQFFADENVTLIGYAVVPTGVEKSFTVKVQRLTGSANLEIGGRLQLLTVPFDGLGGNAGFTSAEQAADPTRR